MTFFNKKTEVMQIEMTPYGRYLYSIGKFKPHSYEFVDDDILYTNFIPGLPATATLSTVSAGNTAAIGAGLAKSQKLTLTDAF